MLYPLSYVSFHWRPDSNRRPWIRWNSRLRHAANFLKSKHTPSISPRKLKPSAVRSREIKFREDSSFTLLPEI